MLCFSFFTAQVLHPRAPQWPASAFLPEKTHYVGKSFNLERHTNGVPFLSVLWCLISCLRRGVPSLYLGFCLIQINSWKDTQKIEFPFITNRFEFCSQCGQLHFWPPQKFEFRFDAVLLYLVTVQSDKGCMCGWAKQGQNHEIKNEHFLLFALL